MPETMRIGDILVARGFLDRASAESMVLQRVKSSRRYASVVVQSGRVKEVDVLLALSIQAGVPALDLSRAIIPKEVIRRVPLEIAAKNLVLPVRVEGNTLILAMASPKDWRVRDEIAFATGLTVQPHVALESRLTELIPKAYGVLGDIFLGPDANSAEGDPAGFAPVIKDLPPQAPMFDVEVEVEGLPDVTDVSDDIITDVEPLEEPTPENTKVILVVEDEPEIQKLVVQALSPLGAQVITADRGLDALKLIKAKKPDLIVLDAMLPEVHGFEICRKVKESQRFASTPVLMLSAIYRGWRIAEDIRAAYKVDDFLEKPFRVAELRRRAQQLLDKKPARPEQETLSVTAQDHVNLALKAGQKGEWEEAFAELRAAEALEPFSATIQFLMAQALEKRERTFQAIYHYERSVELRPDLFAATRALAMLYQAKGFRNKAIEMWERSLRCAPSAELKTQIKQYLVSLL